MIESLPAPTPGSLFHHQETGLSGCPRCGWSGVATILDGERQHVCPACGIDYAAELREDTRRVEKVARNAPCPCGSGRKHKKCCLR